jgi:site-specific recombinase XerD
MSENRLDDTPGQATPTTSAWVLDPRLAAREWLQADVSQGFAEHSVAQYSAMVGQAADWLAAQRGRSLLDAGPADMDAFMRDRGGRGGKPASASTVKRYASTLRRLFDHLCETGLRSSHPMDAWGSQHASLAADRQVPRLLTADQAQRYIRWTLAQPRADWCDLRDAALRVIYLSSGLTVDESLNLEQRDLVSDLNGVPAVRVRAASPVVARVVPLLAWAQGVMREWQLRRARMNLASELLFPARQRSPVVALVGGTPLPRSISTSELYETIRPAVQAAGFADVQRGPQTLRNTYAALQLDAGVEPVHLQALMGLHTRFSIDAIRRERAARAISEPSLPPLPPPSA